jgi:hypothetical protein
MPVGMCAAPQASQELGKQWTLMKAGTPGCPDVSGACQEYLWQVLVHSNRVYHVSMHEFLCYISPRQCHGYMQGWKPESNVTQRSVYLGHSWRTGWQPTCLLGGVWALTPSCTLWTQHAGCTASSL